MSERNQNFAFFGSLEEDSMRKAEELQRSFDGGDSEFWTYILERGLDSLSWSDGTDALGVLPIDESTRLEIAELHLLNSISVDRLLKMIIVSGLRNLEVNRNLDNLRDNDSSQLKIKGDLAGQLRKRALKFGLTEREIIEKAILLGVERMDTLPAEFFQYDPTQSNGNYSKEHLNVNEFTFMDRLE